MLILRLGLRLNPDTHRCAHGRSPVTLQSSAVFLSTGLIGLSHWGQGGWSHEVLD